MDVTFSGVWGSPWGALQWTGARGCSEGAGQKDAVSGYNVTVQTQMWRGTMSTVSRNF